MIDFFLLFSLEPIDMLGKIPKVDRVRFILQPLSMTILPIVQRKINIGDMEAITTLKEDLCIVVQNMMILVSWLKIKFPSSPKI
jgi:hypothetical protein